MYTRVNDYSLFIGGCNLLIGMNIFSLCWILFFASLCDSTPYPQVIQFGESSMFFGHVFCDSASPGRLRSVNSCMS